MHLDLFEQPGRKWSFDVDSDAAVPLWGVPKGIAWPVGRIHRAALSNLLQVPPDGPLRLPVPDRSPPLPPLRCGSAAAAEPNRLLKKAHLRRWHAGALAAAYRKYASLGPARAAWHLDLFEQPEQKRAFQQPARFLREGAPPPWPNTRRTGRRTAGTPAPASGGRHHSPSGGGQEPPPPPAASPGESSVGAGGHRRS